MVTVGIDPHKHVHVAVAVDAAGRQVGRPLIVKNGPHLITGLLTWIRSISGGTPVTWAIEDGHGFARRLADGLLLAGQEGLGPDPPHGRPPQVARRYQRQVRPR